MKPEYIRNFENNTTQETLDKLKKLLINIIESGWNERFMKIRFDKIKDIIDIGGDIVLYHCGFTKQIIDFQEYMQFIDKPIIERAVHIKFQRTN